MGDIMKFKLLVLLIISTLLIIIIYKRYYIYEVNITSINSLNKDNYEELLIESLLDKIPNVNINIDYSNEDLEIENLISSIEYNTNNIQSIIHNSKVLIISIGNNDIKNEKVKVILNEYKKLFQLLRKYNNHEIIFISPNNFKYQQELKEITNTYKIIYINSNSYNNKRLLVNSIINKITYIKK